MWFTFATLLIVSRIYVAPNLWTSMTGTYKSYICRTQFVDWYDGFL